MAIASVSALASLWHFCTPNKNSEADFSAPQSKSVLWSWNFFNLWRSKVALGGKICNLNGRAVVANAWRVWIIESVSPHLPYFCLVSDQPFLLQLLGSLAFSISSLPRLLGSSRKVQAVSELTLICQTFLFFKVSICGSAQCKWVVFQTEA